MTDSEDWSDELFLHVTTQPAFVNLCGTKLFPDVAPANQKAPYVIYSEISNASESTHSGPSNLDGTLMQFTAWADTRSLANRVRRELRKILECVQIPGQFAIVATFSNELATYDPDTKLRGSILELRFLKKTNL